MGFEPVGSAWVRTSKKGTRYLSILLDQEKVKLLAESPGFDPQMGVELKAFKNKDEWLRENPKRPQYQIVCDEEVLKLEQSDDYNGPPDEDDIPF